MSAAICMISTQFREIYQQRELAELLLHFLLYCSDCGCEFTEMSAVPQGAFAACKVRENEQKYKRNTGFEYKKLAFTNCVNASLSPLQYNSKLMNSVWGMYNRYSVHNLKKNIDDDLKFAPYQQQTKSVVGSSSAGTAHKYSC